MSQHGCPERLSSRAKAPEDGQASMELLVETLTGTAFEMTVSPSDTVLAIKSKIFRVEGIPVSAQHLVYGQRELVDARSLREERVRGGARLRLVLGLRGGPVATRRLPRAALLADVLDNNREEVEWCGAGGCKVTVVVYRDGERLSVVRVRDHLDPACAPLHRDFSGSGGTAPASEAGGAGALRENAVTMGKMLELRRRMQALQLRRHNNGDKVEIQKTRSEETLPTHLREPPAEPYASYDAEGCFALAHDADYAGYPYECGFGARYTLLPPIGARDAEEPRPVLPRRQSRREEEGAILEECAGEPRAAPPHHPAHHHYGCVVGGCARGHSASALQLRVPAAALGAPLSCSTSELQNLQRNSRLLPGLSRARPREHLHLSDEGLHLRPPGAERRVPAPGAERPLHRLYTRRDTPGAEDRLYMRRETSQPSIAEDRLYNRVGHDDLYKHEHRLYNRKDTSHLSTDEDRLYNRKDHSNDEDRLYNRKDSTHLSNDEDRLYNRKDHSNDEDRLYNRKDTTLPSNDEDRLYNRIDSTHLSNDEDRLYNRRNTSQQSAEEDRLYNTHIEDRLYSRRDDELYADITQDIYLRQDSDGLYIASDAQDNIFGDVHSIGIDDRLYMHTERNLPEELYISSEQILQDLSRDHDYLRDQAVALEDRYMENEAGREERLYNRGGKLPEGEKRGDKEKEACEVPAPVEATVEVKEKKIRLRCGWCKKRLSVATVHRCRCGGSWCARHRYAEVHGCAWDYKATPVPAPAPHAHKLPKI